MSAIAAYNTLVKLSGTPTSVTGEACSGSGTTWQITSASKRVLDPSVTPDWYDNGVAIVTGDIVSVNYLTGTVVFTGSKTGPITVDATYLPMLTIAQARSVDVTVTSDDLDTSVFGSQWKTRIQGLKEAKGKLESLDLMNTDIDPGAGSQTLQDIFTNGTQVVLEVLPDGTTTNPMLFWSVLLTTEEASAVDALVVNTAEFSSVAITALDGTIVTFNA